MMSTGEPDATEIGHVREGVVGKGANTATSPATYFTSRTVLREREGEAPSRYLTGSRVCASMWKSVVEPETPDTLRVGPWPVGHPACVFLFFSSRLGCLGSLVLSVLLTLLLLWIFRVI
jgi:hypothetical protein